ncbi:ankyrin [Penicillium malachiteum]|nr:ankyrin [Penicillium malachiteum]
MINARDKQGATVFNYAVRSDTALPSILSTVQMLLDAKPLASTLKTYDLVSTTALEDAVRHHFRRGGKARDPVFTELIDTLLENDANTHLCLHGLCGSGWDDSISPVMIDRMLNSSGINETDTAGCTALHYLVRHMNQMEAVRHLIRRGANVNAINHKGNTPLHEVMGGVQEESIKILVEAGGSMDQANGIGKTPTQLLDEITKRRQR